MAASSIPDPEYKAIFVKNETSQFTVFLFVFFKSDPICWLPLKKKSIEPGKEYFYRDRGSFKYQIRTQKKDVKKARKNIVLKVKKWEGDKLITVKDGTSDEGRVHEEILSKYPNERQIAIRRKNMEDGTSGEYGRDLYAILKLDMKVVRKASPEDQDKMIRKAYYRQMLIFHPDRNPDSADDQICQEIVMAYSILGDREKRALYHDQTDYNGGWLSKSRWRAIFKPEAHGSNEKWKRIGLLVFSAVLVAGGIAITICTAGMGVVAFFGGNAAAGALIGGAIQGAFRVVSYDSIENGVKVRNYAKSFAIGAVIGAAGGGACAGIASVMIGIENVVYTIAEAGVGEIIGGGAATGAANGALAAIANDIDAAVVDGEDRSIADCLLNTVKGAVVGSGMGMICAGVSKLEAKVKTMHGKTKLEAAKQKMLGVPDCVEHVVNPAVVGLTSSCDEQNEEPSETSNENATPDFDINDVNSNENPNAEFDWEELIHAPVITYYCKEPYFTRMIVDYLDDRDNETQTIVEESGSTVELPMHAKEIKVKFQNQRFIKTWCDVKKYDRKNKCWCKPTVPHVFKFPKPVTRTFTLEGSLYYVAVMKVVNEKYDDVDMAQ